MAKRIKACTNQEIITTPKAFHRLLKFKVSLTATIMQTNIQNADPMNVTVIKSSLKPKILIIPGALENPIALKSANCVVLVFGSGNNLTPTKYTMYAQTNQLINENIGANIKLPAPSEVAPIPAAELDSITTIAADKVAFLSFWTSLKTSGSILTDL